MNVSTAHVVAAYSLAMRVSMTLGYVSFAAALGMLRSGEVNLPVAISAERLAAMAKQIAENSKHFNS